MNGRETRTPADAASHLPSVDALLPPAMARRAEDLGVKKVSLDALSVFVLSILAVGSSRVDLQACKLEYSIVSPK